MRPDDLGWAKQTTVAPTLWCIAPRTSVACFSPTLLSSYKIALLLGHLDYSLPGFMEPIERGLFRLEANVGEAPEPP
jgi:hypothetical protein